MQEKHRADNPKFPLDQKQFTHHSLPMRKAGGPSRMANGSDGRAAGFQSLHLRGIL